MINKIIHWLLFTRKINTFRNMIYDIIVIIMIKKLVHIMAVFIMIYKKNI